jgi:DNA-binding MarR family transcriptional regulator
MREFLVANDVGLQRDRQLEAKGWIQASAKEDDSRFRLLSLTREGRRNLPVLAKVADTNDARFFDCLASAERDALRELLTKVAAITHP